MVRVNLQKLQDITAIMQLKPLHLNGLFAQQILQLDGQFHLILILIFMIEMRKKIIQYVSQQQISVYLMNNTLVLPYTPLLIPHLPERVLQRVHLDSVL